MSLLASRSNRFNSIGAVVMALARNLRTQKRGMHDKNFESK